MDRLWMDQAYRMLYAMHPLLMTCTESMLLHELRSEREKEVERRERGGGLTSVLSVSRTHRIPLIIWEWRSERRGRREKGGGGGGRREKGEGGEGGRGLTLDPSIWGTRSGQQLRLTSNRRASSDGSPLSHTRERTRGIQREYISIWGSQWMKIGRWRDSTWSLVISMDRLVSACIATLPSVSSPVDIRSINRGMQGDKIFYNVIL